jgi:hypothetical protein
VARTRPLVVLAAAALCSSCGPSEEEIAAKSADSIVAIAKTEGHVYRGTLGGRQLALMVHECKVYNLEDAPRKGGKRPSVLEPDFYPWPTVCSRQAIEADTAWVTVQLGRTGLGAGGCCATGGTYRSRDGRVWEREGPGGAWKRVASDSAQ